jgi:hypothetical protein
MDPVPDGRPKNTRTLWMRFWIRIPNAVKTIIKTLNGCLMVQLPTRITVSLGTVLKSSMEPPD